MSTKVNSKDFMLAAWGDKNSAVRDRQGVARSRKEIADRLDLSLPTIDNWMRRLKELGVKLPKFRRGRPKQEQVDPNELNSMVSQ